MTSTNGHDAAEGKPGAPPDPKSFILDTNVLLHNPDALASFGDNWILLPIAVIEELDRFKAHTDELGRNARQVIRTLDALRAKGHLGKGVPLANGGRLQILLDREIRPPGGLLPDLADNNILGVAYALHERGENVIFVSKDINARVKADALGLKVEDFEKQRVDVRHASPGWRELIVPGADIDRFYEKGSLPAPVADLWPNEFVMLRDGANEKHTALARYRQDAGEVTTLTRDFDHAWNVSPRSASQRMAFELLLDDSIRLVTLVGRAGTGKTLMALAAGLTRVVKDKTYEKLFVSRPIMPLGRDIGYLPGDKDEKLAAWMGPIFDNLKFLLSGRNSPVKITQQQLFDRDLIELEAITYIRGRSIPGSFIIVDEAQNLTPHEVKTIISRAGEDTKMVLTGDPEQIDNPYLDASSNGLSYTAERMKGSPLHGHVALTKSERSDLAELAASRL